MNPIILPPAVSYPARAEGLGKYDNFQKRFSVFTNKEIYIKIELT